MPFAAMSAVGGSGRTAADGWEMSRTGQTASGIRDRAPSGDEQRLAACMSEGVARVVGGAVSWANASLLQMSGRGRASALVGLGVAELFADTGSGLPGPGRSVECLLRRPDGGSRRVVCRCGAEGGDGASLWVIEDVSVLRTLETELLQTSQALQRANAEAASLRQRIRSEHGEREEFLTLVSHELRTPLTVISGYNRLLLSGQVGSLGVEQERFLQESSQACERLFAFIDSLMEVARVSAGDEVLELGTSALEPVIESVARLLKPLLDERGLELEVGIGPDAAHARFDRLRIERVLTNLIGNAVKFAPRQSAVRVATRLRPEVPGPGGPPRDLVELSVADAGPGVAEAEAERIFEPYTRGDAGRDGSGLGLGLAICRRLVEAHGGTIWVEPRPGGGSRFAFTLPASEGARARA